MPPPPLTASSALSLAEYTVLGLAAQGRSHGFAIAREMDGSGDLGRIYAVARPAVYRAVERLLEAGLLRASTQEPGERGPRRTPLHVTAAGRRRLEQWLSEPAGHIRDLRTEFLVKLALVDRAGGDPRPLIAAQIAAVEPIVAAIEEQHQRGGEDPTVSLWRAYSARAARDFLAELSAQRR